MGTTPSSFESSQNPVENVNWYDCNGFFNKINAKMPDLALRLPSEAEWEYACRAGTTTPFSFGDNITTSQVNFNGDYPYAGLAQGEYRKRVVPVKFLPCNDWGFYEMHGNIWEWCADNYQEYISTDMVDPLITNEIDKEHIVLRGGDLSNSGRLVRSAIRRSVSKNSRSFYIGFRFALVYDNPKNIECNRIKGLLNTYLELLNNNEIATSDIRAISDIVYSSNLVKIKLKNEYVNALDQAIKIMDQNRISIFYINTVKKILLKMIKLMN